MTDDLIRTPSNGQSASKPTFGGPSLAHRESIPGADPVQRHGESLQPPLGR
jgi:hypothetical protein